MHTRKDEEEFIAMLDSCRGTIFKVCLLYTDRSPEAIEDLFQEIACDLWESYTTFKRTSSVNTWVYRVAKNTALMAQRRTARQPSFMRLDKSLYDTVAAEGGDENLLQLYELVGRLPEEEKILMDMYLASVPQNEIARQLGISELAVNKRISRLKQKLKQMNNEEQE